MKKLIVNNFLVTLGGEQHKGWLPENATTPLPIPIRKLLFDFAIEEIENEGGFLLLYKSQNDVVSGDTWHRDEIEAIESATKWFNIPKDLWKEIK